MALVLTRFISKTYNTRRTPPPNHPRRSPVAARYDFCRLVRDRALLSVRHPTPVFGLTSLRDISLPAQPNFSPLLPSGNALRPASLNFVVNWSIPWS